MTPDSVFAETHRELLHDAGFISMTNRSIVAPDGSMFQRIVVEHPGAVAVVPMIGDDVILIRQYRAAAGTRILEIPAGKLDVQGENAEVAACRELAEETGYVATDLVHLIEMWTAIGFSDERITIFLATDIEPGSATPIGPEEVDAEVLRMSFERAIELVVAGEISDAKSVAGLLLTARIRASS